jgi:hypothetical protein
MEFTEEDKKDVEKGSASEENQERGSKDEDEYSSDSDSQWQMVDVEKFQDVLYQSFEESSEIPVKEEGSQQEEESSAASHTSSSQLSNSSSSQLSRKTHSTVNSYSREESDGNFDSNENISNQNDVNKSIDASRMLNEYIVTTDKKGFFNDLTAEVVSEGGSEEDGSVVSSEESQVNIDVEIELQRAVQTIAGLNKEVVMYKKELDELRQENNQLRAQNVSLEEKCNTLDGKQKKLRDENVALEEKYHKLCSSSDEKYRKLRAEKITLEDKFQKECEVLNEQQRKLYYDLREMELGFSKLQSEKDAQDKFLENMQNENKGKEDDVLILQQELNDMMKKFSELRNDDLERYEREDTAKRDALVLEFREQKQELEEMIDSLTNEISDQRFHFLKRIDEVDVEALCLQKENSKLSNQIAQVHKENDDLKKTIFELKMGNSDLENDLLELRRINSNLENVAQELREQNSNLGNEKQDVQYVSDLLTEQEKTQLHVVRVLRNLEGRMRHLETETRNARQHKKSKTHTDSNEEKQDKGSEEVPSMLARVDGQLMELENEVILMISEMMSPPTEDTPLLQGNANVDNEMKISLRKFMPNDIAIFFPTPKGDYLAFNVGAPHHFLSAESKALIGQDKYFQKLYVFGRIIMKETFTVEGKSTPGGDSHPKGLAKGMQYHALSVTSVTNQF